MSTFMSDIASLVFLVALILLGIGLMRPSALALKNRVPTRKQIGLGFGAVIIICMVVVNVNSPEQSATSHASQKTSQTATTSKQPELQTKAPISNTPTSTNTAPATTPTSSTNNRANVLAQMNTIQADLSGAWSSCQSDTSSCQAKVASIPDYQKLYDSNSANFNGKASDDFSSWRSDIGIAEGDMKQWAINQAFNQQSATLTAGSVNQEVQNVQDDIHTLSND